VLLERVDGYNFRVNGFFFICIRHAVFVSVDLAVVSLRNTRVNGFRF
jgi:hypothetical protein